MRTSLHISNEADMLALGRALARACGNDGAWIYLSGELGAGKTTLVRGFMRELGYDDRVKSPTYTLVEPYEILNGERIRIIYHFDFYRINTTEELFAMGLDDYFQQNTYCLVEWPEQAIAALPVADLMLSIQAPLQHQNAATDDRQVTITSQSSRGAAILERFTHA